MKTDVTYNRLTHILEEAFTKSNISSTPDAIMQVADCLIDRGIIVPPVPLGSKIYTIITRRMKPGKSTRIVIRTHKLTLDNLDRVTKNLNDTVFLSESDSQKALLKFRAKIK